MEVRAGVGAYSAEQWRCQGLADNPAEGYRAARSQLVCSRRRGRLGERQRHSVRDQLKSALLKHVRVLTIASHDHCLCAVWTLVISELMPNIEVLRVAPAFDKAEPHWSKLYKPTPAVMGYIPFTLVHISWCSAASHHLASSLGSGTSTR